MSGFMKERVIWLLDWCWPFPLGIGVSVLAFILLAGVWLGTRTRKVPSPGRPPVPSGTPQVPEQIPAPPARLAPGTPEVVPGPAENRNAASGPAPAEVAAPSLPPKGLAAVKPARQERPATRQLTAKQKADFSDRMTIGQFLVDRKEYSAAVKEFQAALAIDPSSREARTAIQKAREASSR